MNYTIIKLGSGLALAAVAGGAIFAFGGNSEKAADETVVQVQQILIEPTKEQKKFQKMSIEANQSSRFCAPNNPPKEFGTTSKELMGLKDAIEKLAFEKMRDENTCDCLLDQINWEQADQERQKYKTGNEDKPYNERKIGGQMYDLRFAYNKRCRR